MVEETMPIYTVQCNFPEYPHIWTNVIAGYEFKDEDDAREQMNTIMALDGYDGATFRIIKTTTTICVIAEKVREKQS